MIARTARTLVALLAVTGFITLAQTHGAQAAKKSCKPGHWHHGASSSTPYKSKSAAKKAAIKSWREFTAWEYGVPWAYWKRSADKIVNCDRHPGKRWTCNVQARPCARIK